MLPKFLILSAVLSAALFGISAGTAAELTARPVQTADNGCLSPEQRRHVAASGKVVSLSKAIRAARARRAELVSASLCQGPKGLVYRLTLLAHDGKVTRATVDAASGKLTDGG